MQYHTLLAAAIAASAAATTVADTVVLEASRDNTLYESTSGNLSNGAGDHTFAGVTLVGDLRRALIDFDVAAAIPAGSTIDSVTLTLNMSRSITGPQDVTIHRVLADWGESTSNAGGEEGGGGPAATGDATWVHTFFPDTFWTNLGGDFEAAASATASVAGEGSYSWSSPGLVSDVQGWLDGTLPRFGWMLRGDEAAQPSAKRFDSRENGTPANRPQLVVEFTPPAAAASIVITEILYNPASTNDNDWEYVEILNVGDSDVDLSGWVFDDDDEAPLAAANIAGGIVPVGDTAVLFNADANTVPSLEAAWGTGINFVPVTQWSAIANDGDTVALWTDFASYDAQNLGNAAALVAYDDSAPWPSDDGASSISLVTLSADNQLGESWELSAAGVRGAYESNPAGENDGINVGSPGVFLEPLVVTEIMYNPASTDDNDWEFVEVLNASAVDVDLAGWVLDDDDFAPLAAANIAAGTVPAGGIAVLFNADGNSVADLQAAWGPGVTFVPVVDWPLLANGGDTFGLWNSIESYAGFTLGNAQQAITYTDAAPWPVDDGVGSIFLVDLDADNTDGANWRISCAGQRAAFESAPAGLNAAVNVGSPGAAVDSCNPDLTGDGIVDLADLNIILANFNQATCAGDVDGDGFVDLNDLNAVLAAFNSNCP